MSPEATVTTSRESSGVRCALLQYSVNLFGHRGVPNTQLLRKWSIPPPTGIQGSLAATTYVIPLAKSIEEDFRRILHFPIPTTSAC